MGGVAWLMVLLISCTQVDSRTIGVGASDVEAVEVYLYAYESTPDTVSVSVIRDRREIDALIRGFTDVPVTRLGFTVQDLGGHRAAGLRFVMRDGRELTATQVFVEPLQVVLVWPDGQVTQTTWGSAIGDYPTPSDPAANTPAFPDAVPEARIP